MEPVDLQRMKRVLFISIIAVMISFPVGPTVIAQTTSASVSGTVQDAQGAVLPGATVTLINQAQGVEQSVTTDELGNFLFAYVRPGSYTLKATMAGFKVLERTQFVVNANDKLSLVLTLDVGGIQEIITVSAEPTPIQTASGERSYALTGRVVQNIAVNGRSFFSLVALVPGIVPTADTPTQVSNFVANGQRANSNNLTIDGVTNVDTGDNGGNMTTSNLDAIEEFKVLTANYQAEYGRAMGAQVSVVTKSGSREFHGSAYWYHRNSALNANSWTNNRAGIKKSVALRNDAGYTLGGPIYIPGKFNQDRSKWFFFWSQEWQRRSDPVGEVRVVVPTERERQGDFSQSVDRDGKPYPYIRDYTTGLPCGPTDTRGCFQDGGVLGRIPANRLYQPGLAILKLYPAPNVSGQVGYNYTSQQPSRLPRREDLIRVDFHQSSNWRISGRFMDKSDDQSLPYGLSWMMNANIPTYMMGFDNPGYNWAVTSTGILSPSTSVEILFGSAHNSLDIFNRDGRFTISGLGLKDLPRLYPSATQNDYPPRFQFGGRIGTGAAVNTHNGPFTNFNTTYDASVAVTHMKSAHALKAGIFFQRSLKDQSTFSDFNGTINFNDNVNNPFDAQFAYANAALGIYNSYTQASAYVKGKFRYNNLEWYIQDNWKAHKRLTLDYGVRFYWIPPQYDTSLQAANFLPEKYDASKAARLYYPARNAAGTIVARDPVTGQELDRVYIGRIVPNSGPLLNGVFQAGQGIEKQLVDSNNFRVVPRVGFAADLRGDQSLVLRGGMGIFYDRPQGNLVFDQIRNPPASIQPTLNYGLLPSLTTSTLLLAPPSLQALQHDLNIPRVMNYNLGIQLKVPFSSVLDVSYVGAQSDYLAQRRNLNAVPYGAAFRPENQNPTATPSTTPGATALPVDFLRPYRGYADITIWEYLADSNYNALQASLNRRFHKNLLLAVNYTWSKALGTVSDDWGYVRIDQYNKLANYGVLSFDRRHNLTVNWVYEVPKATDNRALGAVVNNWQVSGIYRAMSGEPYSVGFSIPGIGNVNLTGSYTEGARVVIAGKPGKGHTDDPYRQLDTSVFRPPQVGSIGLESPRLYLTRNPLNNLDLSLSKRFRFGEVSTFELRLDMFNAFNHTQLNAVNSTINFRSLTDPTPTNLPFDASGNLVNRNGFGTISSVRSPRQMQFMLRLQF